MENRLNPISAEGTDTFGALCFTAACLARRRHHGGGYCQMLGESEWSDFAWERNGAFTVQMYIQDEYNLASKALAAGFFSNEDSIVGPLLSPPYPASCYRVLADKAT